MEFEMKELSVPNSIYRVENLRNWLLKTPLPEKVLSQGVVQT